MPAKTGRSGMPGNDTKYHRIGIKTPHPELLQAGSKVSGVKITANKVPTWEKGKFTIGAKGTLKR